MATRRNIVIDEKADPWGHRMAVDLNALLARLEARIDEVAAVEIPAASIVQTLVAETTVGSVAQIDITNIPAAAIAVKIYFNNLTVATDDTTISLRVSTDNGSSVIATGYEYIWFRADAADSSTA